MCPVRSVTYVSGRSLRLQPLRNLLFSLLCEPLRASVLSFFNPSQPLHGVRF
jgi:hypothetical protein